MKLDHMDLDELRIRPSGNRPTDNSPVICLSIDTSFVMIDLQKRAQGD